MPNARLTYGAQARPFFLVWPHGERAAAPHQPRPMLILRDNFILVRRVIHRRCFFVEVAP